MRWSTKSNLPEHSFKIFRSKNKVLRVFFQFLAHPSGLGVRVPRLRFEDKRASLSKDAVHFLEESFETFVSLVEVDPFRYREAGGLDEYD